MENPLLIWAALCMAGAVVIFLLELVLPSGGLLGLLGGACFIASLVMFYGVNSTLGLVMSIVSLAATPFAIALAIKVWPSTPFARMLTLKTPPRTDETNGQDQTPDSLRPGGAGADLIGKTGITVTELRPVGSCKLEGARYDCIADGAYIQRGAKVRAVGWSGSQLRVRLAD